MMTLADLERETAFEPAQPMTDTELDEIPRRMNRATVGPCIAAREHPEIETIGKLIDNRADLEEPETKRVQCLKCGWRAVLTEDGTARDWLQAWRGKP